MAHCGQSTRSRLLPNGIGPDAPLKKCCPDDLPLKTTQAVVPSCWPTNRAARWAMRMKAMEAIMHRRMRILCGVSLECLNVVATATFHLICSLFWCTARDLRSRTSQPRATAGRATFFIMLAVVLSAGSMGLPPGVCPIPHGREHAAAGAVVVAERTLFHSETNRIQPTVEAPSSTGIVSQPRLQGLMWDSGSRVSRRTDWPSADVLLGEIGDLRVLVATKKDIQELGARGGCMVIDLRHDRRGHRFWAPITGSIGVTNLLVQLPGLQHLAWAHQVRIVGANCVVQTPLPDASSVLRYYGDLRVHPADVVVVNMRPDY